MAQGGGDWGISPGQAQLAEMPGEVPWWLEPRGAEREVDRVSSFTQDYQY